MRPAPGANALSNQKLSAKLPPPQGLGVHLTPQSQTLAAPSRLDASRPTSAPTSDTFGPAGQPAAATKVDARFECLTRAHTLGDGPAKGSWLSRVGKVAATVGWALIGIIGGSRGSAGSAAGEAIRD